VVFPHSVSSLRRVTTLVSGAVLAAALAAGCSSLDAVAPSCSFQVSPTSASFSGTGGTSSLSVSTASACKWHASSNAAWLTVNGSADGQGDGKVYFAVAGNASESMRTGKLEVGDVDVNVLQAPANCNYAISQTSATFGPNGGNGAVDVMAPAGCESTATTAATWIVITAGCVCVGNGTVEYTVMSNLTGVTRSATMLIAGYTFTVTQTGKDAVQIASTGGDRRYPWPAWRLPGSSGARPNAPGGP